MLKRFACHKHKVVLSKIQTLDQWVNNRIRMGQTAFQLFNIIFIMMMMNIFFDIMSLQEAGYDFIISGKPSKYKGTITFVSADNPASASLGGFKESAAAFRYCRHCMGTESQMQSKVFRRIIIMLLVFVCSSMIHSSQFVQTHYTQSIVVV